MTRLTLSQLTPEQYFAYRRLFPAPLADAFPQMHQALQRELQQLLPERSPAEVFVVSTYAQCLAYDEPVPLEVLVIVESVGMDRCIKLCSQALNALPQYFDVQVA
jgi:hypothetical protein